MEINDFNGREYYIPRGLQILFRGILMLPFKDTAARDPIIPEHLEGDLH